MRRARVYVHNRKAGVLEEHQKGKEYVFIYDEDYLGAPVSLTMPTSQREYRFTEFPPFFDGVLPEGPQLEGLLKQRKLDRSDLFGQLIAVGADLIGAVTVEEIPSKE